MPACGREEHYERVAPAAKSGMNRQEIVWRNFGMLIPADWEMLLFSSEFKHGRCVFADRNQFRLEFNWQTVPRAPDFERMLRDYRKALEAQKPVREVGAADIAGWHGLAVQAGNATTARFGRHFPGERCLVEMVFIWPGKRAEHMERQMLESVREEAVAADGTRRWRAFGMEMRVDAKLKLRSCVAQPGRAKLVFDPGRDGVQRVEFERLGMTAQWLKRPVPEWLRLRVPATVAVRHEETLSRAGHSVSLCAGDRRAGGLSRLLGRRCRSDAYAWVCPADGRLYCLTLSGALPGAAPLSAWTRLTCCDEFRGAPP